MNSKVACVVDYVHRLTDGDRRPWLVVGKGPSLANLPADRSEYHVMTLNHTCFTVPDFTIAHFVDIEAVVECSDYLNQFLQSEDSEGRLCLPWHPHRKFRPWNETLISGVGVQRPLSFGAVVPYANKQRLLSYNASSAAKLPRHPGLAHVTLRAFGAVAAFNILAMAGVRDIFSVGIDGGTIYHESFDSKNCLANGNPSFDTQWPYINATIESYKINYTKL